MKRKFNELKNHFRYDIKGLIPSPSLLYLAEADFSDKRLGRDNWGRNGCGKGFARQWTLC